MGKEYIEAVKKECPDYAVVAYINTTAELKTICDVCVTSSCAVELVKKLPEKMFYLYPTATSAVMWQSRSRKRI